MGHTVVEDQPAHGPLRGRGPTGSPSGTARGQTFPCAYDDIEHLAMEFAHDDGSAARRPQDRRPADLGYDLGPHDVSHHPPGELRLRRQYDEENDLRWIARLRTGPERDRAAQIVDRRVKMASLAGHVPAERLALGERCTAQRAQPFARSRRGLPDQRRMGSVATGSWTANWPEAVRAEPSSGAGHHRRKGRTPSEAKESGRTPSEAKESGVRVEIHRPSLHPARTAAQTCAPASRRTRWRRARPASTSR
jgi:hypothetical protein